VSSFCTCHAVELWQLPNYLLFAFYQVLPRSGSRDEADVRCSQHRRKCKAEVALARARCHHRLPRFTWSTQQPLLHITPSPQSGFIATIVRHTLTLLAVCKSAQLKSAIMLLYNVYTYALPLHIFPLRLSATARKSWLLTSDILKALD
jgi:hypothetical protein